MQLIDDCDHITVDEKELPKVETEIGGECSKDFQMGTYVIVDYEGELFPGEITEVYEDGVRVSCMEKSSSVGSTWRYCCTSRPRRCSRTPPTTPPQVIGGGS